MVVPVVAVQPRAGQKQWNLCDENNDEFNAHKVTAYIREALWMTSQAGCDNCWVFPGVHLLPGLFFLRWGYYIESLEIPEDIYQKQENENSISSVSNGVKWSSRMVLNKGRDHDKLRGITKYKRKTSLHYSLRSIEPFCYHFTRSKMKPSYSK